MGAHDVSGDGEAEAGPAGFAVSAGFEALKGFEDAVEVGGGDAGAFVFDLDVYEAVDRGVEDDLRAAAVGESVADEVGDRAFEGDRAGGDGHGFGAFVGQAGVGAGACVGGFVDDGAEQGREVEAGCGFGAGDVATEGEGCGDHGFEFIEVEEHFAALFVVFHPFGAEFEPGDRCSQVVADGGEQESTVGDEAADAGGHSVEGGSGGGDFLRAVFGQGRGVDVAAELLGGGGQDANGGGEAADGPGGQQGGGCGHDGEGDEEADGMPGPGRRGLDAGDHEAVVGGLEGDQQGDAWAIVAADGDGAGAHRQRQGTKAEIGADQPLDFGRCRAGVVTREDGFEGEAQTGDAFGVADHCGPGLGRLGGHGAVEDDHACA